MRSLLHVSKYVAFAMAAFAAIITLPQPGDAATSTSNEVMRALPGEIPIPGTNSRLTRNANGLTMRIETVDLNPDHPTTVWWIVVNNPENCGSSPCSQPDFFNPATRTDFLWATGTVVDGSGSASYGARLNVGDTSNSIAPNFGLPAWGVIDPFAAEVHLVIRDHGPKIQGLVNEMIKTFNAGCVQANAVPGTGTPGPNNCQDRQGAPHVP